MTGKIATWNCISLQIIYNWKQHPAPVWALLLTSSTANSSKIHWASCNAGAVSVMLGASELIIPSGRVNSSVVESLKKTDTNSELNMLFHEVSRVLCSSTSVLFLCCCFDFFGLGMEPNPAFAFTFSWVLKKSREGCCKHLFLEIYQQTFGLLMCSQLNSVSFKNEMWPLRDIQGHLLLTHTHTS